MYAYSLYLFFDFAGYTAFAIGVGYLFGIHTPENFQRPFLARDIRDFWNRWHISLSWWFRDHVYMRFVMAASDGVPVGLLPRPRTRKATKGGHWGSARPRARKAPVNGSVQGLFGKPQYSLRTISA